MAQFFMRLFFIFILLFSVVNSFGQSKNKVTELNNLFDKAHQLGVFNGNVLVVDQGKVIYRKAMGQADASGETKLTTEYRFHIGSIAKEFNAMGIMMLVEQGKIKLDDPISKYLPELPIWTQKIKIKNILQYTSGVPQSKWREINSDSENMDFLKKVTQLDFEPGTKYAYNNNDVFLQRRVIEKVTNKSFKSFVNENLLQPSGIKNGIVDPSEEDPLVAKAYNNKGEQNKFRYEISGWTAVNLDDFYKWSEAINSFKLINPTSTLELMTPFSPGNQTGLGKGEMKNNKVLNHSHDGTANNYQALLVSEATTTIILMTNNKQGNLYPISESILAILKGQPYSYIKKSYLNDFQDQFIKMNGEELIAFYQKMKKEQTDSYDFSNEDLLNDVGYFLINQKKIDEAILVFTYNTQLFPSSANLYDSLGEAYYVKGDKPKAIENYTQALKLDPNLGSAKAMIMELKK